MSIQRDGYHEWERGSEEDGGREKKMDTMRGREEGGGREKKMDTLSEREEGRKMEEERRRWISLVGERKRGR
jgi:hypothetical protein